MRPTHAPPPTIPRPNAPSVSDGAAHGGSSAHGPSAHSLECDTLASPSVRAPPPRGNPTTRPPLTNVPLQAELPRLPEARRSGDVSGFDHYAQTSERTADERRVLDLLEGWKIAMALLPADAGAKRKPLISAPFDATAARQYVTATAFKIGQAPLAQCDLVSLSEALSAMSVWRRAKQAVPGDTSAPAIAFSAPPNIAASFDALLADMGELLEESAPVSTLVKDATAWKRWEALCADFGIPVWRPSAGTLTSDEVRREHLLFNAYNAKQCRVDCKPKRGNKFPRPASALNSTLAVKRVLKRGGVTAVATPELTALLKGMLRQYVRLHGPEALLPHRSEPLTNGDAIAVLQLTHVNGKALNWEHPFWCSFRAFITTGRAAAFRKADVLPVTKSDFDLASASRSNLSWYLLPGQISRFSDPS